MSQRGSYRPPEHRVERPRDGAVVVELLGEHDLATRDTTDELLAELVDSHDLVVVDVSEASYIDSSILHSMVRAHRRAEERGSKLRVQLGSAAIVRKLFEVSELTSYLEVVRGREQALRD
jgi:anti-sigma B factor antagonist